MKKTIKICLVILITLSLTGCSSNKYADLESKLDAGDYDSAIQIIEGMRSGTETISNNNDSSQENNISNTKSDNTSVIVDIGSTIQGSTTRELEENLESEYDDLINELESEWETLSSEITTFEGYQSNAEKISDFYDEIVNKTNEFSIRIREYALKYSDIILNSNESNDDKYDDLDDIYDDIYDGVADDIYDDIYDGLLDDMYDYYYDGILDDAYNKVPYDDWSDMRSDEYDNWSDARSDTYEAWSDCRSDVYKFWSKLREKTWSDDLDKAKEEMQDFSEDIAKLKSKLAK